MNSPDHPWSVWFPCFHTVFIAGLQKIMTVTGFSTVPDVITHIAGTTGFRRSYSKTNKMQALHRGTQKCNAWCVAGSHCLVRHKRRAICSYPGCRKAVRGMYHIKYTVKCLSFQNRQPQSWGLLLTTWFFF